MRTLIQGGWIVGHADGQHQVFRDGVCVIEDDRILHVGKAFAGAVDATIDARGKLVSPGLISTHQHVGTLGGDYAYLDVRRPEIQGRNYLNWYAGLRDRPRYRADPRIGAMFGLAQTLRHGATTVVEIGGGGDPAGLAALVEELGSRAYTGPMPLNLQVYSHPDGRFDPDWSDARGEQGLRASLAFAERYDGAAGGRVRAILAPGHTDTCSEALLREVAHQAGQTGLPVTVHAAINPAEVDWTLERYRLTPVQLLERVGLLGTRVILGHGVFISGHSWLRYPDAPDLRLLGERQATISHSPMKYWHMGVYLESLRRYVEAGVNVTIGTDFSPRDILAEMRCTMLMSRVADRSFLSGTPRQVFDAATVNAARALGRDDLGRLAPGAKADVVIFDFDQLHLTPTHDPIKALLDYGVGTDVEQVLVDGRVVVRDGRLVNVDERALLASARAEAERIWADAPNWGWGGATIDEMVPPAYPLV